MTSVCGKCRRGSKRASGCAASLPMSWQWRHGSWLHATVGVEHQRDNGTKPWAAVGVQHKLSRAADLFAEWGAVRSRDAVAQLGLRWWAKREKLAIYLGLARHRGGDERVNTVVIGLSAMDLSF